MKIEKVMIDKIEPNKWNPNQLTGRKYESLKKRIKTRDPELMSQPVLVRSVRDGVAFEIIDGEHRWRAAKEAGSPEVWCVIAETGDDEAKVQTIAMNVLRGDPDVLKLAQLIADLANRKSMGEIAEEIGFTDAQIQDYMDMGLEDITVHDVDEKYEGSKEFQLGEDRKEVFAVDLTPEEKEKALKVMRHFDGNVPSDRFMAMVTFTEEHYDKS